MRSFGRRVEPHYLRLLAEALAKAEAEIERHADHERHVGALQPGAAGAAEAQLVVGGQAAAAEAVEEDRNAESLGQCPQLDLSPAPVETGPRHDDRALGRGEQCRGLLDTFRRRDVPGTGGDGTSTSASLKTTSSG